ncbi:MAG TPA: hypothetical protein VK524_14495 [Polyangiaceae bacterium]|nr:hypothetical protein [Polyangiaceae bacterium]
MGIFASERLVVLSLSTVLALACSNSDFSSGKDAGNGPNDAAGSDRTDSGNLQSDASDSGGLEAGETDAGREAAAPVRLNLEIENDADDATWIGGADERLAYGEGNRFIEVGADSEFGRAGLRFKLPIAKGSTIHSATLRVRRVDGTAQQDETMLVQVWDTANLEPFSEDHAHLPRDHAPAGLWPSLVNGFLAGTNGSILESPDLTTLVQHLVDRPDWEMDGAIGFQLAPDTVQTWLALADSSGGESASLQVSFTPAD